MNTQQIGEVAILLGAIIVAVSLAPILTDLTLALNERSIAIAGVAAIILGEALVLSD